MNSRHDSHVSDPQVPHSRPGLPEQASALLGLTRRGGQRSSWRTLRHRQFRMYFLGSVTSDFGTWLQNTAQVLLAYRLAHSAFAVGLVTCAQFSSPLVVGPWAGVMADRFGGRKTLLGTQVISGLIAVVLACLEFCGALGEWALVTGALLGGLAYTFALPARNVIVQRMVPEAETRPAYVMDAVSYNLGRAVAPPLSILLIWAAGYGWVFAANALTFAVFTITLIRAETDVPEPKMRSKVRDGFLIAKRNREILFLLLMVAAVTIADDPVLVLGPALASKLHVSGNWSGWFIAALGTGSVVGSLRRPRHIPDRLLVATALAGLGVCMVCFVSAPWVWVSFFAALGAGVTCLLANSMTRTLLSQRAGREHAGSVMAVFAIAWAGSKPLASLTDGLSAAHLGVQRTGIIFAIPAFMPLGYLLVKRLLAASRAARPEPAARPAVLPGQPVLPVPSGAPVRPALPASTGRRPQPALAMLSVMYGLFALSVLSALTMVSDRLHTRKPARHGPTAATARPHDVAAVHALMAEFPSGAAPASAYEQYAGIYAFEAELGDRQRPARCHAG